VKIKELLSRYIFHIFAVTVFLLISIYKSYPNIFNLKKDIESENPEIVSPISNTPIYVDLSGAVVSPGVYEMPSISRVGDLISKGGGFSNNASVLWISRNINLAKLLYDTQKIYVPYEWETYGDCTCTIDTLYLDVPLATYSTSSPSGTTSDSSDSSSSEEINVNTATADVLDSLPGIGATYAQKIIDNRPYTDLSDFASTSGLSETTINKISDQIIF